MSEGCYALENTFGLPPGRTYYAYGAVWVRCCVPEEQGCNYEAFAALPAPPRRCKLVLFKQLDELFLVSKRFKTQDFFAEVDGVGTELLGFFQHHFFY